ncbi:MAG: MarR family transcriptional regulator [Candidatus Omnitrophica bacterium]|nr:MarR family transcriptional regulator [Candidatus Omnitrophota bacterium]MBU0896877.1 MarR family transcriptional regulator [Candidatus Omnitrophota bacterium]MBU1134273.1 MarR family transcriptional regulator [Candidatus Omnitrophota bacterium]MBU1524586.1 MarR family transcriptional regulator [Candidatus Omnitrophota bacterium]MBU1810248.1 MarR family transcriptional regulator [Candidatus Omnitrophota bacterium]
MKGVDFTEKVAKEVSVLIPKLIVGIKKSFFEIEELTNRQIIILLFVYENKRANISDIANNFLVSLPTITGIVDRLVKKGYLERIHDEVDRRVVYVALNDKGRNFVNKFLVTVKKRWHKILTFLNLKEQAFYLKILKKIIKALDEARDEE